MGKKNDLMSKLNVTNIKAKTTTEIETQNVIDDILSPNSVHNVIKYKKTEYISFDKIRMYENNKLSIDNIKELKQQIEQVGLLEPLVVVKQNDEEFLLISGHRRLTAIQQLASEGKWNENHFVECKIIKLEELSVTGTREMKIELLNLTANEHRNLTDADTYNLAVRWMKIIQEFRDNGINVITIKNVNGEAVEKNIKGEKTRSIVSEAMEIGETKVREITKIQADGSEKLIESVNAGKTSIHTASKVAELSKEEQDKFLEEALTKSDTITLKDVDAHNSKINKKKKEPTAEHATGYINADIFKDDIKDISKQLRKSAITLTNEEYKEYQKAIETIKSVLRA